jgi:hypothetical protein
MSFIPGESFQSRVFGVTHEEKTVAQVRRAEARSRQNRRPDGVADSFQVICHKVEPAVSNRSLNLLAKDNWREALPDKPVPDGPEVPGVIRPPAFSGLAERLAGAGTRPDGPRSGPPCKPQRVGPAADPGEEMEMLESGKLFWFDILDPPRIDPSWRQPSRRAEVSQPLSGKRVVLVVIGAHRLAPAGNGRQVHRFRRRGQQAMGFAPSPLFWLFTLSRTCIGMARMEFGWGIRCCRSQQAFGLRMCRIARVKRTKKMASV